MAVSTPVRVAFGKLTCNHGMHPATVVAVYQGRCLGLNLELETQALLQIMRFLPRDARSASAVLLS